MWDLIIEENKRRGKPYKYKQAVKNYGIMGENNSTSLP